MPDRLAQRVAEHLGLRLDRPQLWGRIDGYRGWRLVDVNGNQPAKAVVSHHPVSALLGAAALRVEDNGGVLVVHPA